MSESILDKLFDEFADDLLAERSTRTLVIVGSSRIDQLLFEILNAYFLPKAAKARETDELLEGDRPLSTFSSRIKLCYRLGLIDQSLFKALEKLRAVRNPSAHQTTFDANQSPIREHLTELRSHIVSRASFALTKRRYFDDAAMSATEEIQCLLLTVCVLLLAIRKKMQVTTGHAGALRIAAS